MNNIKVNEHKPDERTEVEREASRFVARATTDSEERYRESRRQGLASPPPRAKDTASTITNDSSNRFVSPRVSLSLGPNQIQLAVSFASSFAYPSGSLASGKSARSTWNWAPIHGRGLAEHRRLKVVDGLARKAVDSEGRAVF